MLFDKNGIYYVDNNPNDYYDFAVDIMNGITERPKSYTSESTNTIKLYDLEEALKKGNAFPNLYSPYRGYAPRDLKVGSAREKALLYIQMLEFSINDLNLYLDLNPNDRYAYQIFKKYVNECKNKKKEYSRVYGPLTLSDVQEEWEWSKGVWPWERGAM